MKPTDLIFWAIAIMIALSVLSATGIQDWLAKVLTRRPTRDDLQQSVADLERRVAALEGTVAGSKNPTV
jgi:hypothetical protein